MIRKKMRERCGRKAVISGWQDDEDDWRFPEQNNILRIEEEGGIIDEKTTVISLVNSESFPGLEALDDQLLPRLSIEIVLTQIVPKLPRRVFHILSSVNQSWLRAIRSRQVFDARVRSRLTETMFVLSFCYSMRTTERGVNALCLYAVREKTWHKLPDFQHKRIARGLPNFCGCVSLDGKVYVLGGESEEEFETEFKEVYVLDFAGQTGWRQCADMLESRQNFAYGVIDGKIYVVGGTSSGKTIRRSEVYDPKENTWSSISPMISTRADHRFVTTGEELWSYRGSIYDRDSEMFRHHGNKAHDVPSCTWTTLFSGLHGGLASRKALYPEVYHPSTGEWDLVKIELPFDELMFVAQGKMLTMDADAIYEFDDKGYRQLCSFSYSGVEVTRGHVLVEPFAVYSVDDELFALVISPFDPRLLESVDSEVIICQSKVFGKDNDQFVWEKLNGPFSDENLSYYSPSFGSAKGDPFMFPIQL